MAETKERTFRHGIHPEEHKDQTLGEPIKRMPFPDEVVLPLSQHLGAPSKPVVKPGDKVYRGQLIAGADGFMSVPLHSSVTGRVRAVEKHIHPTGKMVESIIINTDPNSPQTLYNEGAVAWQGRSTLPIWRRGLPHARQVQRAGRQACPVPAGERLRM